MAAVSGQALDNRRWRPGSTRALRTANQLGDDALETLATRVETRGKEHRFPPDAQEDAAQEA